MSYGKRLEQAIKLAGSSRTKVAEAVKLTPQAIGQCIRGDTEFLKVDGSAKVAAFLDVDHYWLATGEGSPRPDRAWPFTLFLPSQYKKLDQKLRDQVENELAGAVQRQEMANAKAA